MNTRCQGWVAAVLLVFASATSADDNYQTNRATELRVAPDPAAASLRTLDEKTPLTIHERQSGWGRTTLDKETGWVRMLHLRASVSIADAKPTAGGATLGGLNRVLGGSGNIQSKSPIATVGVRGLSAEELASAQPDLAALARMKQSMAGKEEAETFARKAELQKTEVAEIETQSGKRGRK